MKKLFLYILFVSQFFYVNSQSSIDYFHMASKFYINSEKKNAKRIIEEAMKKFPNDPKLRQVSQKINKLPEDPPKDNKNKEQNKPQDKPEGDQNQQQQQNKPQMSKQNAQQLLDALQQDEKNAQDKAKKQQVRGTKNAEKDW